MSIESHAAPGASDRSAFFIGEDDVPHEENDHHELILQKADALASENCLKEAIHLFSVAMRYGPLKPEQLSTFVDCILRNFKRKTESCSEQCLDTAHKDDLFDCPNCHHFLGEPVTIACGHTYCKRCLQRRLLCKCRVCNEAVRGDKANILLCGLVEKWFPEEHQISRTLGEVDALCKRRRYDDAISLASELIDSGHPDSTAVARLSRAEAFMAMKQYHQALEDTEHCSNSRDSAEVLFRKAMVLNEMGQVDESLQVFLQCLSIDEDFPSAKRQVEKILCGLLSPTDENVKVGLRETTQSTSPRLRCKTLVFDAQEEPQSPVQRQDCQHQGRAASAHSSPESQERRWESLERPGLSRALSLRMHGSISSDEGLKRVCSAPQLGDQEKGSLLKRKLSVSETEHSVLANGNNKHKKQGVTSNNHRARKTRMYRIFPEGGLDPNDVECSLCMRLFYEPVTTPCGHTFCKSCLERCLDHMPQCPLCKESLKEYLASRNYIVTALLDTLIKQYLGDEYEERSKVHQEETRELSDLTKNVPIFVCTMAYPTVPCPLHVFEPRYRLMIRRCMDTGTRQFGMCISDPEKGFVDYGCMLIVRSVHFLPDGRSVVDTIGGKRFHVLSRGMKDGYSTANIEHLEDTKVEDSGDLLRLQELHDAVYEQACVWFQNLKNRFRNQILQHFGAMPEQEANIQATTNGPAWCWWLLAVLPIDPPYQLSVLSLTSLRDRLVKIQHILTYLQSIQNN
ncbi:LON peptidase N-terminal domain and ring finger 1, like [Periophthalmus magnuspinnatus]|uniref:LON peptidase N-terminal domain and ring finger 1, like n=1 Tax=Periophthalmus magnuspinnatus TaxID=409849 RepID=UPI00145A8F60|nr:LON peptidase N-terminal domain and ring finger 1, like [Periophthalmus magnuspinnatus]